MKRVETKVTEKVTTTYQFNSTEGYLLISVWAIYSDSDYECSSGELDFMEEAQRACNITSRILDELVDWDENDTVFDYEFADDVSEGSLAQVIFDALCAENELDRPVREWLHRTSLPLKKPKEPEFRAGIGMADDVQ